MTFKLILIAALIGGIAYVAITYTDLWVAKVNLTDANQSLSTRLTDTTKALGTARGFIAGQESIISGLISTTANQAVQLADYRARDANARANVYQGQAQRNKASNTVQTTVDALPQDEQFKAANKPVRGFGAVPASESGKVAMIAGLKGVVASDDTIMDNQSQEITIQADRAKKAEDKISDLEIELNGVKRTVLQRDEALLKAHNADADRLEKVIETKRIFKKKLYREAEREIRSGRVQ